MKPEVKEFSRDHPCTKLDLWNCFKGIRGWRRVQIDQAHAVIGVNAPKYMKGKGYLNHVESKQTEYYRLTEEGAKWLDKGMRSYLRNHPTQRKYAKNLTKDM